MPYFNSTLVTRTAGDAQRHLRDRFGDVALSGVGGYRERSVGDSRFALSEVVLDGEFEVQSAVDVITVAYSSPGYRWRTGSDEGELSEAPALFEPGVPMAGRLRGRTAVTTVTIPKQALEEFASATYGAPTAVRFDGAKPASKALGRTWVATVRLVDQTRLLENDLVRSNAYRALALMTLEAFRLTGDRTERRMTARASEHAYRRAAAFIDDHLHLPITETAVAQAVGISESELRVVFAAHSILGWSAAEYLRRGRLAAAHLELMNADPARGESVTTIAARWGFSAPSKFAMLYKNVYGVNPRWVLDH